MHEAFGLSIGDRPIPGSNEGVIEFRCDAYAGPADTERVKCFRPDTGDYMKTDDTAAKPAEEKTFSLYLEPGKYMLPAEIVFRNCTFSVTTIEPQVVNPENAAA
jgi:hypothetical protein